jgi:cytochrome c5
MGAPSTRRLAALLASAAALAGCAAALPHATLQDAVSASARWPGTGVRDLERGRMLYARRCSGCHTLYLPRSHAAEDWPTWVEAMTERSRLTRDEAEDVTRLLVTLAGGDRH